MSPGRSAVGEMNDGWPSTTPRNFSSLDDDRRVLDGRRVVRVHLYLYLRTVLSRVFFGGGEASLAITLAGFAVAYLMRPLGAIVFGHIGDRFGRRRTMLRPWP